MAAKIPLKFTRVAAAFDEAARGWRMCESCGSKPSGAVEDSSLDNLSALVASFMEEDGNAVEFSLDEEIEKWHH